MISPAKFKDFNVGFLKAIKSVRDSIIDFTHLLHIIRVVTGPSACLCLLENTNFLVSVSRSEDGRYLVTGECGHLPSVRVWDVQDRSCVGEFPGHKYGINCVAFAPNNKYIVSVSCRSDRFYNGCGEAAK